jgi:hypothetical protein
MPSPYRDAFKSPGFAKFPSNRGGWRAEKRKSYGSCLAARGASRRASRGRFVGAGPRFPVRTSRSSRPEAGGATSKSSASSWQELIVVPGGAPAPPECLVERQPDPQGAAPRPASRTPHDAPFKWTRWMQHKGELARGENFPRQSSTIISCRCGGAWACVCAGTRPRRGRCRAG